jgi:uncharacterized protein YdeI (YjbR/CyaY-like superfamily)
MPAKPLKTTEARDLVVWRKWLTRHHETEPEVWLIFYKQHTGRSMVTHKDALDEALCFGWIDSLVRRLDDDRYAIKFTPRKPDSRWSDINRKRYEELKAAGRLKPHGIDRAPTGRTYAPRPTLPEGIPKYIKDGLKSNPSAWSHFEKLAPSHRRHYVGWIHIAKRPETKARRLEEAIRLLSAGKLLGLK